jgi:hypothetical protein
MSIDIDKKTVIFSLIGIVLLCIIAFLVYKSYLPQQNKGLAKISHDIPIDGCDLINTNNNISISNIKDEISIDQEDTEYINKDKIIDNTDDFGFDTEVNIPETENESKTEDDNELKGMDWNIGTSLSEAYKPLQSGNSKNE